MPYPISYGPGGGITSDYSIGSDGGRSLVTSMPSGGGGDLRAMMLELAKRYMAQQAGGASSGGGAGARNGAGILGSHSRVGFAQPYDHARGNTQSMVERAAQMEAYNSFRRNFLDQYADAPATRYGGSFGSPSSISSLSMPQLSPLGTGSGGSESGYRAPSTAAGEAAAAITALSPPKPPAPAAPTAAATSPAPAGPVTTPAGATSGSAGSGAAAGGSSGAGAGASASRQYDEFLDASPEEIAQYEAMKRLRQRQPVAA
jgi:hypothetical protein